MIAPSNPYICIWPILAVRRSALTVQRKRTPVVAVSPVIGGKAVKGPADAMLKRLAGGTSPAHVARCYPGLLDALVIDQADAAGAEGLEARPRAPARHPDADEGPAHDAAARRGRARGRARRGDARVIEILPVEGLPEIDEGDDLAALIAGAPRRSKTATSSASPTRSCRRPRAASCASTDVEPSNRARSSSPGRTATRGASRSSCASRPGSLRARPPLVIAETPHGFVCASAGVDASNAPEPDIGRAAARGSRRLRGAAPCTDSRSARAEALGVDRHRHVRPRLAVRDRERRDRRGRNRGAARPPRPARPGRLRAALDGDRRSPTRSPLPPSS